MKRFFSLFILVALTFVFAASAMAEPQLNRENVWRAKQIFNFGFYDKVTRYMQLPVADFVVTGDPVSASTAPGMEVDDLIPNIVWADNEVTPAQITFQVPVDYHTGGTFKVFVSESDSTTPNYIDFSVYINKADHSTAADSSASDNTSIAMLGTTPETVTLTPTTDFANLVAGDWVTFNIWRDNTYDGTGDLEVKGVVFSYK